MNYIKINSDPQNNGLWSTPLNVTSISYKDSMLDISCDEIKLSAYIAKLAEYYYPHNISIDIYKNRLYYKISNNVNGYFFYKNYEVFNKHLYFINCQEDRVLFDRMIKMSKIKNNNDNT